MRIRSGKANLARLVVALAFAALAIVAVHAGVDGPAKPPRAHAAVMRATPGNLESVFARARRGDRIRLAPGDYGTFRGAPKAGRVRITGPKGRGARVALAFDGARNITLRRLTITSAVLEGDTRNITVRDSTFPGQVTFRTGELRRANILFERNLHAGWNACRSCGEGRIFLPERTNEPSGITIRRSEFRGGMSDGILNGSNGTRIIGNTFHDLVQGGADGVHTDSIQLYGSRNTVIRRNLFYSFPSGIMAPDGADHEVIVDNVFRGDRGNYPFAIMIWSDRGSVIRHNTLADGDCQFNLPCGILSIGSKAGMPAGRGTIVRDNILSEISIGSGSATLGARSHNLIVHAPASGHREIRARPRYVGGRNPKTFRAHALRKGSPGRGNASDGTDRGARARRGR